MVAIGNIEKKTTSNANVIGGGGGRGGGRGGGGGEGGRGVRKHGPITKTAIIQE